MLLKIRDESMSGSITGELTLDVLSETITVRELIRSRVYQEVQDYNLRISTQRGEFRGLVTPAAEPGPAHAASPRRARDIDWHEQFTRACDAFDRRSFLVLIDDRQAVSLDETFTLRHDTKVSFIKLVMLVGG